MIKAINLQLEFEKLVEHKSWSYVIPKLVDEYLNNPKQPKVIELPHLE